MSQAKMASFFGPRYKLHVHIVQAIIVLIVLTLAGVRLFTRPKNAPMVRTDSMAIGMGAKSHIIIFYQILTEHVPRFQKYASRKANLILNSLEIVFWAAVAFMGIQANIQTCTGSRCILSWIIVVLAIILSIFASYTAVVSFFEYRQYRENGETRGSLHSSNSLVGEHGGDTIMGQTVPMNMKATTTRRY